MVGNFEASDFSSSLTDTRTRGPHPNNMKRVLRTRDITCDNYNCTSKIVPMYAYIYVVDLSGKKGVTA
eukprot:scaffold24581_cov51-Attheya_sp.AAC.3